MTFPPILDAIGAAAAAKDSAADAAALREEAAARQVATQFEALLLRQLTASLAKPLDEEGEDDLFGGGGGLGLSRQLFGEQLADTMAQAGGIGLADVILGQLRAGRGDKNAPADLSPPSKAAEAARLVRDSAPAGRPEATPAGEPADYNKSPEPPHVRPRRVFPAESTRTLTPEIGAASPSGEPVRLHMYVKGAVRSNFGVRRDPFTGARKFHSGVDIPAPHGTPIGAAAAGRVVFAGRQRGYGNTVVVEHADGTRTRYAHAERLFVSRGESVEAGQAVASVGSTGRSTGPHLHFEVMRGGRHLNPLKELAKD